MMSKKSYLPRAEKEKSLWLDNFAAKLGTYGAKYGVPTATITAIQQDAAVYKCFLDYNNKIEEYSKKLTAYKHELADGAPSTVAPAAPASPFPPVAGVFKRACSWGNIIKSSLNYLESDGRDLGLEGAETSVASRTEMKPSLSIRLIEGGRPEIVWQKGKSEGLEIYVDRGTGVFQFLNIDLRPNYIDIHALPTAGKSEIWKYKAIYRLDDHQVGQWSDVVEISVKGNV